jgi:hypothetical protein
MNILMDEYSCQGRVQGWVEVELAFERPKASVQQRREPPVGGWCEYLDHEKQWPHDQVPQQHVEKQLMV